MDVLYNRYRGIGLPAGASAATEGLVIDPAEPRALLRRCPAAAPTAMRNMPGAAATLGVGALWIKDETHRMGLGSFKALGAAYVIAREATRRVDGPDAPGSVEELRRALEGSVYACASAGNHGLSAAAGARIFGARAVIYLAEAVPEAFAERLRGHGAEVVRPGGDYESAMARVAEDAEREGWVLLSDSSWPGYTELPMRVMEGYLAMGVEIVETCEVPPTHIVLQAGVGGLAAAMTSWFRRTWGDAPTIIVVEPEAAPALIESIRAGGSVATGGPASTMGRLDCKEPSLLALAELARGADVFVTVGDDDAAGAVAALAEHGIDTTPSGAAGIAALEAARREGAAWAPGAADRVLAFVTEGPEEAP